MKKIINAHYIAKEWAELLKLKMGVVSSITLYTHLRSGIDSLADDLNQDPEKYFAREDLASGYVRLSQDGRNGILIERIPRQDDPDIPTDDMNYLMSAFATRFTSYVDEMQRRLGKPDQVTLGNLPLEFWRYMDRMLLPVFFKQLGLTDEEKEELRERLWRDYEGEMEWNQEKNDQLILVNRIAGMACLRSLHEGSMTVKRRCLLKPGQISRLVQDGYLNKSPEEREERLEQEEARIREIERRKTSREEDRSVRDDMNEQSLERKDDMNPEDVDNGYRRHGRLLPDEDRSDRACEECEDRSDDARRDEKWSEGRWVEGRYYPDPSERDDMRRRHLGHTERVDKIWEGIRDLLERTVECDVPLLGWCDSEFDPKSRICCHGTCNSIHLDTKLIRRLDKKYRRYYRVPSNADVPEEYVYEDLHYYNQWGYGPAAVPYSIDPLLVLVLAHELGHCFLGHRVGIYDHYIREQHEQNAQTVASLFLRDPYWSYYLAMFSAEQPYEYYGAPLYGLGESMRYQDDLFI